MPELGDPGAALRLLLEQADGLHDTRSVYERKLLTLLRAAELPLPITNTWVGGVFVDGVWPDLKLVLEFDSWKFHGGRDKFESDRIRDQHLLIADHRVMRITKRQIDHRSHALIARIASVISALRREGGESHAARQTGTTGLGKVRRPDGLDRPAQQQVA